MEQKQYELTREEGLAVDKLHTLLYSYVNDRDSEKRRKSYNNYVNDKCKLKDYIYETRGCLVGWDVYKFIVAILSGALDNYREDRDNRQKLFLN